MSHRFLESKWIKGLYGCRWAASTSKSCCPAPSCATKHPSDCLDVVSKNIHATIQDLQALVRLDTTQHHRIWKTQTWRLRKMTVRVIYFDPSKWKEPQPAGWSIHFRALLVFGMQLEFSSCMHANLASSTKSSLPWKSPISVSTFRSGCLPGSAANVAMPWVKVESPKVHIDRFCVEPSQLWASNFGNTRCWTMCQWED